MPFDYSTIFAGAEAGEVWLPDGTSHFQDAARTTAAGADDPIGSLTGDQAHFNANQSDAGLKPTLRQDAGGKWYFEHAGDYLTAGAVSDWNYLHYATGSSIYVCAAVRFGVVANPDTGYALFGTTTSSGSSRGGGLYWNDNSAIPLNEAVGYLVSDGSSVIFNTNLQNALSPQSDGIVEVIRSGTTITCYVNNVAIFSTGIAAGSSSNSAHPLTIGAFGSGGLPLTGRIYGLLITNTIPSAANRAAIQVDMNARLVTPAPSLGNTATLAGTSPVEPGERVLIHRDNAGTLEIVAQIVPDASGVWEYVTASTDDHYVTYLAATYPPLTHGPYTPA